MYLVQELDPANADYAPMSNDQRACELVEEAAAEAGLLGTDTQRLVHVRMHSCAYHLSPAWNCTPGVL